MLPLYRINAENVTLVPSLLTGSSLVMPHRFLVQSSGHGSRKTRVHGPPWFPPSSPSCWTRSTRAEGMDEALARIRFIRSSSAPLAPSLHRAFEEKFKLLLIEAKGSTSAAATSFPIRCHRAKTKSARRASRTALKSRSSAPTARSAARRAGGDRPARAERHERLLQGSARNCRRAYPRRLCRTGDLACIDEEGYFFVVGRAKELIIKGGMNIAPRQIDEALEAHPGVLEAAAVGVQDHYFGEDIVAFAVPRPAPR